MLTERRRSDREPRHRPTMIVEIVCTSADDVGVAVAAGAGRVELCAALELGGLTPSGGLAQTARAVTDLPILAMIRPRSGGFLYTDAEFAQMQADIPAMMECGLNGIVTGVLRPDGAVDIERSARLAALVGDRERVFHRAFDATPDPFRALEDIIAAGFTRILTSGQAPRVTDAVPLIRELIQAAKGRIEILPAGGLRAANLAEFVAASGCDQVHLAPMIPVADPTHAQHRGIAYGAVTPPSETHYSRIDPAAVAAAVRAAGTRNSIPPIPESQSIANVLQ